MASPDIDELAKAASRAARLAGADVHDVLVVESRSTSLGVREGELEALESNAGLDIGLRVMLGKRQAVVSGSDVSDRSLQALAERAVAMARVAPEDPHCGLAPDDRLADPSSDLDLADPHEPTPDSLKEASLRLEAAAQSVDGVAQVEGASASAVRSNFRYLTSHGFLGGWESTRHTQGVSAFASRDGAMERDYAYQGRRWAEDLPSPEEIGQLAGERAVRRLGSRQLPSGSMPVVFDRRVADGLLSALLSAVSGPAIARGTSFLKDKQGEAIFPEHMTLVDDPHRVRGLGSRPFDAEGIAAAPLDLVRDGVLSNWLLNLSAARKLGLETTARANRSVGSAPGVSATNCAIPAGDISRNALIAEMGSGLLVAEMFGPSLNPNTGDFSVGVAGFAVESGEVRDPVSEITIAGNLLDMFAGIVAADDLVWDGAVVSPTLRVPPMTVAGS